jgi:RNA polymerase sigma-70 factor (ECF subfamily)
MAGRVRRYSYNKRVDREEILLMLRERIVAFAASRISRDVAEDLSQEVLILLHEKYPQVIALEELLPLSMRIMRFKMAAQYRKSHRRGEYSQVSVEDIQLPDLAANPATELERKQMLERLSGAIRQLGDKCQQLIRWKLAGKTFAEIQALSKAASINTVYTWDFRCRKQLLELLGGKWEDDRK